MFGHFREFFTLNGTQATFNFDFSFIYQDMFSFTKTSGDKQTIKNQNQITGVKLVLSKSENDSDIQKIEMKVVPGNHAPLSKLADASEF
jgi:hypothetical protein